MRICLVALIVWLIPVNLAEFVQYVVDAYGGFSAGHYFRVCLLSMLYLLHNCVLERVELLDLLLQAAVGPIVPCFASF